MNLIDEIENVQSESKEYVETTIAYYKLLGFKIAMKSVSSLVTLIVSLVMVTLIVLFLSLALAFELGTLFESNALGFLTVAGIYTFFFLLFLLLRRKIIEPVVLKKGSKMLSDL